MITSDPCLRQYVERLTELNKGRAHCTSPDPLGEFVLWDVVSQRCRNIR